MEINLPELKTHIVILINDFQGNIFKVKTGLFSLVTV
jgi:hypothetical protein